MSRWHVPAAARAAAIGVGMVLAGMVPTAAAVAAVPGVASPAGRYGRLGAAQRIVLKGLPRVPMHGASRAARFRPRSAKAFDQSKRLAREGLTGRRGGIRLLHFGHSGQRNAGGPAGRGSGPSAQPSGGSAAAPVASSTTTTGTPSPSAAFQLMNLDQQVATFGSGEQLTPPDTQLAAGPVYLMETNNAVGSVWTKSGTLVTDFNLNAFFNAPLVDAGYGIFDPRVLYDAASGRWFASASASSSNNLDNQVFVAVSQTSDPTQGWYIFTVASNTNGLLYDQPKLGVSGDKVTLSWNDFSYGGQFFTGQETWILQKSAVMAGAPAADYQWGPDPTRFSLVPAQILGSGNTEYLVYNNADGATLLQNTSYPSIGVVTVTGTPAQGDVAITESDPQIAATSAPPNAAQPGGGSAITTDDDRFLSAVWQNGVLWTAGNDGCVPAGGTATRACLRLIEVTTGGGSPAVAQDFDAAAPGTDLYYPAVGLDGSGNLFVAFSASSTSLFASAMASAQAAGGPAGSLGTPVTVQPGQAVYCGFDCQSGSGNRWGDYSAVAADPSSAGLVWTTAEYADTATDQGNWGTATAGLRLADAPGALAFSSPAQSGTASAAAGVGPVTVQLETASGAPIAATSATTVDLGSSSSSTVFAATYDGPAVSSVTIPAGATGVSFYFGDTRAGSPTLTATGGGLTSASQTETVTAAAAAQLAVSAPADATTGTPIAVQVTAEDAYGNTATSYGGTVRFTSTDGSALLPADYTYTAADGGVHSFSVTFETAGSQTVTATDTADTSIAGTSGPVAVAAPLAVTTTSLPGGTVGAAYSATLAATGGTPPYTWSVAKGSLPAGLSLDTSTGVVSGTPTTAGTSSFTLQATDSLGRAAQAVLSLTVDPAPLAVTTTSLPGGTVGAAYSATLAATGGTPPYTWSVAKGSLPAGLSLDTSTGVVSGTPTAAGTSSFTVQATDSSSPAQSATQPLSITVATAPLTVTTTSLPGGTVGAAYSATLAATGGTPPYTWSVTKGSLPAGLSLDASTGVVSGTPTAAGTSSFTVQATDSSSPAQNATQQLSITVAAAPLAPLAVTTTSLPGATAHQPYSATLQATGGSTPYVWSVVGGSLPPGLGLASDGTISGKPKHWGTYQFTVQVADSSTPQQSALQTLSVTVSK